MYWNNKNIRGEKNVLEQLEARKMYWNNLEARKMYWNNKNIRGEKNVLEQ